MLKRNIAPFIAFAIMWNGAYGDELSTYVIKDRTGHGALISDGQIVGTFKGLKLDPDLVRQWKALQTADSDGTAPTKPEKEPTEKPPEHPVGTPFPVEPYQPPPVKPNPPPHPGEGPDPGCPPGSGVGCGRWDQKTMREYLDQTVPGVKEMFHGRSGVTIYPVNPSVFLR